MGLFDLDLSDLDPTNPDSALMEGLAEIDPTNPDSALMEGLAEIDPTNPNSALGQQLQDLAMPFAQIWKEAQSTGLEYALEECQAFVTAEMTLVASSAFGVSAAAGAAAGALASQIVCQRVVEELQ